MDSFSHLSVFNNVFIDLKIALYDCIADAEHSFRVMYSMRIIFTLYIIFNVYSCVFIYFKSEVFYKN